LSFGEFGKELDFKTSLVVFVGSPDDTVDSSPPSEEASELKAAVELEKGDL
jgi:hypothetical protein